MEPLSHVDERRRPSWSSLTRPSRNGLRVTPQSVSKTVPPRARAGWAVGLAITAVVALASWLSGGGAADVPVVIERAPDGFLVVSVAPGSLAWTAGARPGAPVLALAPPDAGAGDWNTALIEGADGVVVSVSRGELTRPTDTTPLLAAIVLLGFALATWRWPPASGTFMVGSTILAGSSLYEYVERPLALALWLSPLTVAAWVLLAPRVPRGYLAGVALPAALGSLWLTAAAGGLGDWDRIYGLGPLGGSLAALIGLGLATRAAWRRARAHRDEIHELGARSSLSVALLDEIVPARAASRLAAIRAERSRLAGELHAEIVPQLRLAARLVTRGAADDAVSEIARTEGMVRSLLADRRNIELEALGFVASIETLAESAQARGPAEVMVDVDTDDGEPPIAVADTANRAVAEALENALHHGAATRVAIAVNQSVDHLMVTVSDNGKGIDESAFQSARTGHLGLRELEATAAALCAVVNIARPAGRGTELTWRWPA